MKIYRAIAAISAAVVLLSSTAKGQLLTPAPTVTSPRMYVLDCGYVITDTPEEYGLTLKEVNDSLLSNMCVLVVHPKGTLLWQTGLPDRMANRPLYENLRNRDGIHKTLYKTTTLVGELANIGFSPDKINYLAMSAHKYEHSGNSNLFAKTATWLVAQPEWNAMFAGKPAEGFDDFKDLKTARTVNIRDNHDVFGDGSVVVREAFGHTPGHIVLQLKLKNTGNIILGGDLYTYAEERTLDRIGNAEQDKVMAQKSRAKIEKLAQELGATLWLEHDVQTYRAARQARPYYD